MRHGRRDQRGLGAWFGTYDQDDLRIFELTLEKQCRHIRWDGLGSQGSETPQACHIILFCLFVCCCLALLALLAAAAPPKPQVTSQVRVFR